MRTRDRHLSSDARVTVRKVSPKRWELTLPGAAAPFAVCTTRGAAVHTACTIARYKLHNASMFEHCLIIPVGFKL